MTHEKTEVWMPAAEHRYCWKSYGGMPPRLNNVRGVRTAFYLTERYAVEAKRRHPLLRDMDLYLCRMTLEPLGHHAGEITEENTEE